MSSSIVSARLSPQRRARYWLQYTGSRPAEAMFAAGWRTHAHYVNWREWERNIALARAQLDEGAFAEAFA